MKSLIGIYFVGMRGYLRIPLRPTHPDNILLLLLKIIDDLRAATAAIVEHQPARSVPSGNLGFR